jgi:long-chain acyl-CoA synthetase
LREFSLPALYEVPADGNLTDIVRRNAAQHPDVAVIARKADGAWQDVTASAFLTEVQDAAKGLIASGVQPGDRVALMSRTRYEWTLLDFAIWSAGAVTVPVYETSSAEQVQWILSDSGATACVVESAGHAAAVESVRDTLPTLKHVWQIEAGGIEELGRAGKDISDATVEERGSVARADDPATIVYTSGTTGRPKGCVLTHRAFFAECGNVVERLRPLFRTGECSVLLFLPLAHVFGRLVQVAPMMAPIKLGCVPDIKNLTDELAAFRPTLILGVPRVFEKVYNSARAKAQADGKGAIFDRAADTAIAYSKALDTPSGPSMGLRIKHKVFDKLVYGKLRAVLGGRGEYAISGGAPLGERLGHFFRGIGFTVLEGYGLTESCAATAFNPGTARRSARSASRCRARSCGSRTTGRCCCTASTCSRSTGTTRPPRRTRWPTAGSTPGTSAPWTRTATCGSPAARRRSSSRRAARTSPRPSSRTASARTRWSRSAWWWATGGPSWARWSPSTRSSWAVGPPSTASRRVPPRRR